MKSILIIGISALVLSSNVSFATDVIIEKASPVDLDEVVLTEQIDSVDLLCETPDISYDVIESLVDSANLTFVEVDTSNSFVSNICLLPHEVGWKSKSVIYSDSIVYNTGNAHYNYKAIFRKSKKWVIH